MFTTIHMMRDTDIYTIHIYYKAALLYTKTIVHVNCLLEWNDSTVREDAIWYEVQFEYEDFQMSDNNKVKRIQFTNDIHSVIRYIYATDLCNS